MLKSLRTLATSSDLSDFPCEIRIFCGAEILFTVVATECLAECKNGPVAVLRRDSAEVMIAGFAGQDAANKIREFVIQAFERTDLPLDQIPFRHYPG